MCLPGRVRDEGDPANPYGSWRGSRVFIVASGPSLTEEDARTTEGKGRTIAVNTSVTIAPHADMLYAGDAQWWMHNEPLWQTFRRIRVTSSKPAALKYDLTFVPRDGERGLSRYGVSTGGNSGHQAMCAAYLMGAAEIVLIGFDMMADGLKNHWHNDHVRSTNPTRSLYGRWRFNIENLAVSLSAKGVRVLNASRRTALSIERISLEDLR